MVEYAAVHLTVIAATVLAVALCVLLQYEALVLVLAQSRPSAAQRRAKVLYGILSVILVHTLEVVIFGAAVWLLLLWPATGGLDGPETVDFFECVYLSAVTFSTVGFGDIAPVGPIRFFPPPRRCRLCADHLVGFLYLPGNGRLRAEEMDSRNDE